MSQDTKAFSQASILAVDDTPANLQLLTEMLSQQGYKVRIIPDSSLVLKSVLAHPPDLILLDILMPNLDGYQVCQALKAHPMTQDVPVIFISSLSEGFDKVKAFDLGGVDYITKPFLAEEVIARVENQLRLKAQEKQLQEKNKQLELALKDLQCTQAQLIQTEKMLSLGRIVAGVSHEINNPISFIFGNLCHARHYFQDLMRILELYQQTYPHPTPEVQQLVEDVDLDFLAEDWLKLTDSMQVGAERIQKIVQSLKCFSRLNESELKSVDIHEGIDDTLLLLQHRLKSESNRGEIQVIKDYGQLPNVTCYPSQLNQVFLHLISNAIDALDQVSREIKTITIYTDVKTQNKTLDSGKAVIKITDNGAGMSQEVVDKIFDPFFTTKPVGSGTGLGLSISHQIVVEKHKGNITCVSTPGQGTELIVEIPALVECSHGHLNCCRPLELC
ncbi:MULTISPECIES: response regulator [unclassified Coleofasciculus]|uniref:hybrid sensor histidine kinase/response regulator n=1 Tax=unclassified Coleofasciculus TaxID=2692782 RepID=UPI001880F19D|nr:MULTISPECIES: response regulator [unclassified Coleofasciculus]MBE9129561.1 response regulator [Coleofasciculus sp. LEGE 07081]MBE9152117.1 response regulator [Coleofasciculus sp. LEGE 07092]